MIVVPLIGDSIETEGGVKHTVLSYSPYAQIPSVLVQKDDNSTDRISFDDIKAINGTPVSLTPGKVFEASSLIKRKIQLPQEADKITVQNQVIKVKTLKLRKSGKLTNGIIAIGEDWNTKNNVEVRVYGIDSIERADGDTDFSRKFFHTLYKDYLGFKKI